MEYTADKFKIYTWRNWKMIHWVINPGLAFNELILGQRVPKVYLEDITSKKTRIERICIPCPHCGKIHDGRTWSVQNKTAFKNWFGLYCYYCGGIIPCLTNGFSFMLLALTFPLWSWFRKSLEKSWLEKQPERYKRLDLEYTLNTQNGWIKSGLIFGIIMYVSMIFLFPLLNGEAITWQKVVIGIPLWTLGGSGYSYMMKLWANKKISDVTIDTDSKQLNETL